MKFLKMKTRDGKVKYINPNEVVFAAVEDGGVHVGVRIPNDAGDVSVESGPLDDPQKALDEMMSEAPRIGAFRDPSSAFSAFRRRCESYPASCRGCKYYPCATSAECALRWAFDQLKGAGE